MFLPKDSLCLSNFLFVLSSRSPYVISSFLFHYWLIPASCVGPLRFLLLRCSFCRPFQVEITPSQVCYSSLCNLCYRVTDSLPLYTCFGKSL
eukprot:Gb_11383 [translate_table: standard]